VGVKAKAPPSPDELDKFDDHRGETKSEEQRVVEIAAIERSDERALHDQAQRANDQGHDDEAQPETPSGAQDEKPYIGAEYVEGPMGEIDYHHQTED
jgi:hypothetical protein